MQKHVAIFKGERGDLILSGRKSIEVYFSNNKKPPFGVIGSGDLVYIKPSGKDIIGQFRVKKVVFFDGLETSDFDDLKRKYGKELAVEESFWEKIKTAKFATLIFIGDSNRFITSPIKLAKKDVRNWVVLN